jgi:MYXO-CTERM domain-containing protein
MLARHSAVGDAELSLGLTERTSPLRTFSWSGVDAAGPPPAETAAAALALLVLALAVRALRRARR